MPVGDLLLTEPVCLRGSRYQLILMGHGACERASSIREKALKVSIAQALRVLCIKVFFFFKAAALRVKTIKGI